MVAHLTNLRGQIEVVVVKNKGVKNEVDFDRVYKLLRTLPVFAIEASRFIRFDFKTLGGKKHSFTSI